MKFQRRKMIRIFRGSKMESSDILSFPCETVKKEQSDVFNESDCKTFDEAPDHKNVQLLAFRTENLTHTFYESECDDEVEIVAEYEDVKPDINLLVAKKIDDDFEYHLQSIKSGDSHNDLNTLEIEAAENVIQKCYSDTAEETNFNLNCEHAERRITRSVTKKSNNEGSLKTQIDAAQNAVKRACNNSRKKFSSKDNLKNQVDAVRRKIGHACYVCGNTFNRKCTLKIHIDTFHNGVAHACEICKKSFAQKYYLKIHTDSVHNGVRHACDTCQKTFTHKSYLKVHIDTAHNGVSYACDFCDKEFSSRGNLNVHIDAMHGGITHTCGICRTTFSRRFKLKAHTDTVHNGRTQACDICERTFYRKFHLKKHIDSAHNGYHTRCMWLLRKDAFIEELSQTPYRFGTSRYQAYA